MKFIKQVDITIQLILLSAAWIIFVFKPAALLVCYLVIGSWQVAGMIYHQIKGCYTGKSMPRYYFHRSILVLLIFAAASLRSPVTDFVHALVLVITPALSLTYAVICYKETFRYMIRPLDLI